MEGKFEYNITSARDDAQGTEARRLGETGLGDTLTASQEQKVIN